MREAPLIGLHRCEILRRWRSSEWQRGADGVTL